MAIHPRDGLKAPVNYDTFEENSFDQFYVPIDTYEGRHRYDPKARWNEKEEKALVRRVG